MCFGVKSLIKIMLNFNPKAITARMTIYNKNHLVRATLPKTDNRFHQSVADNKIDIIKIESTSFIIYHFSRKTLLNPNLDEMKDIYTIPITLSGLFLE